MKSKTARRASTWVLKLRRLSSSHSSVAKKLSHMALSKQSPTEPIEGLTPACAQRLPKANEVYWVDSNGRRNITFQLIEDTGLRLPPGFSIEELCVALN